MDSANKSLVSNRDRFISPSKLHNPENIGSQTKSSTNIVSIENFLSQHDHNGYIPNVVPAFKNNIDQAYDIFSNLNNLVKNLTPQKRSEKTKHKSAAFGSDSFSININKSDEKNLLLARDNSANNQDNSSFNYKPPSFISPRQDSSSTLGKDTLRTLKDIVGMTSSVSHARDSSRTNFGGDNSTKNNKVKGEILIMLQDHPEDLLKSKIQNVEIRNGRYVIVEKETPRAPERNLFAFSDHNEKNERYEKGSGETLDLSSESELYSDRKQYSGSRNGSKALDIQNLLAASEKVSKRFKEQFGHPDLN